MKEKNLLFHNFWCFEITVLTTRLYSISARTDSDLEVYFSRIFLFSRSVLYTKSSQRSFLDVAISDLRQTKYLCARQRLHAPFLQQRMLNFFPFLKRNGGEERKGLLSRPVE